MLAVEKAYIPGQHDLPGLLLQVRRVGPNQTLGGVDLAQASTYIEYVEPKDVVIICETATAPSTGSSCYSP